MGRRSPGLYVKSITSNNRQTVYDRTGKVAYYVDFDDARRPLSGICGDFMSWRIEDKETLIISGEGEMDDYSHDALPPLACT